jgi:hypothetical protein
MALGWKVLLPLGLVNFVAVAVLDQIQTTWDLRGGWWSAAFAAVSWLVLACSLLAVAVCAPREADNRPRVAGV